MSTSDPNGHRLSRRQWLRLAAAGGIAAATTGSIGAPWSILAASNAQTDTPEGFLAFAYAQRAQAMTTRNVGQLDQFYDTTNPQLLSFEKNRATFMNDLGSRWNGTILGYTASASLIDFKQMGSVVNMRVYEQVRVNWVPTPRPVSVEVMELRRQDPEKFAATSPTGSRGEITSGLGNRHEIVLEKSSSGWRIVKDAYEEPDLYGVSPDLVPGSWAAVWTGFPSNGNFSTGSSTSPTTSSDAVIACTTRTYNYSAARSYATQRCNNYNTAYCNYNACGGDCANFVSQCFRSGNQVDGSGWATFSGACGNCGTTSAYAGTDTWANNGYLRNWVINSGRGSAKSGISYLGIGDIVNYDWNGDGTFDHVSIVVDGINQLVCCHNIDRCNYPWTLGGAPSYLFTRVNTTYCA